MDDEWAGDPDAEHPRQRRRHVRCVVVHDDFDWEDDAPPWSAVVTPVIYETHVVNLTKARPGVPEHLRGTYAGLAHPDTIAHLTGLG